MVKSKTKGSERQNKLGEFNLAHLCKLGRLKKEQRSIELDIGIEFNKYEFTFFVVLYLKKTN